MRKLLMAAFIIACAAPLTFAQTASDDYNKVDVGVLFSHNRVDTGFDDPSQNFIDDREGFNGVNAFVKGNVSRYVGLVGDYSFHRKSFNETVGTAAVGGGVDFRVSPRVDIRAIQFDYNPTRFSGETTHNFRIGVGIIFR